jgi:hypothetical protein
MNQPKPRAACLRCDSQTACYDFGMPRKLPDYDFRARRVVLTRGDFAWAPKPEPLPSDRVDKATWSSIVTLPDDVAGVQLF